MSGCARPRAQQRDTMRDGGETGNDYLLNIAVAEDGHTPYFEDASAASYDVV